MKVELTVNGKDVTADVEDRMLLVHFLRDVADLTATNIGCETTSCGSCTVLLDGESGTIGATPAVQNAVVDAVAHLGIRHIDMPTTSEKVWRAIQEGAAR